MAESDIAMQNFTANTLRGMGTGGGAGSNSAYAILPDKDLVAEMQPKFTSPIGAYWPDKFFQGMQGFAQSVEINNFFKGFSPPVTPIGGGQKLPNMMGMK